MPNKTIVISVVSTKGGVGKTTFVANLSGLLAALKLRVLVVDADPQASMTMYYPLEGEPRATGLADVLYRGGHILAEDVAATSIPGLSILAANLKAPDNKSVPVENWLQTRLDGIFMLKNAMKGAYVQENFDVVVIDSQGSTGTLTGLAAMAGDFMVASFRPDFLTHTAFYSDLMPLLESLNVLRKQSPELGTGPVRVLLNDVPRTKNARMIAEALRGEFRPHANIHAHPDISVLDTFVPRGAAYAEATTNQCPVHQFDRPSSGKPNSGFEVMHQVVYELMPHLKGVWADGISPQGHQASETQVSGE